MRGHRHPVFAGFFGCKVGDQDAVDAGCSRGIAEFFEPHLQNRIEIAEQDEGNVRLSTHRLYKRDHAGERRAAAQRAFAGALNHWAIRHGIAERYTEFDDVRARARHGQHELLGGRKRRVAGRRDKRPGPSRPCGAMRQSGAKCGMDSSSWSLP